MCGNCFGNDNIHATGHGFEIMDGTHSRYSINNKLEVLEICGIFDCVNHENIFIFEMNIEAINYMTMWFRLSLFNNIQTHFLNPNQLSLAVRW